MRYAIQRCCSCIKKSNCYKQTPTGARIKREYLEVNVRISGASGCDGQTLDGGAAVEQAVLAVRLFESWARSAPGSGRGRRRLFQQPQQVKLRPSFSIKPTTSGGGSPKYAGSHGENQPHSRASGTAAAATAIVVRCWGRSYPRRAGSPAPAAGPVGRAACSHGRRTRDTGASAYSP